MEPVLTPPPPDTIIHIEWDGPIPFSEVSRLKSKCDYGVYQIYGSHPVYGSSVLLYIGLASDQHFGERIPQEIQWPGNPDAGRVEVYVGRLAGCVTPEEEMWGRLIRLAERLLICSHLPAMNTQKTLSKLEPELRYVHVLNWGKHRDLMPEVSGARWTSRFSNIPPHNNLPGYHTFEYEKDGAAAVSPPVR